MGVQEQSLYVDIYEKILHAIKSGEYSENSLLPSAQTFCKKYHVSLNTVRRAIQLLKQQDIVYTVQGNGAYIKPQIFTQPLSKFYSFTDTLKSSNVLIQNSIISYDLIPADSSMSRKTGHKERALFHKLCRLRSAKEYPLMLETTYLPQSRFIKLDLDALSNGSLYEFLCIRYSFHATDTRETFRPVMPSSEEKQLLQMPINTPCMLLERFSYEDDLLSEYTKSVVRGDKYQFNIDLRNQPN